MYYDQGSFDIRCEWGLEGLQELLPASRAVVIVDVLSFTTSVDIAAGNGALVYPFRSKDQTAAAYARSREAMLANATREFEGGGYSLSPSSLLDIPAGTALVLPSPNGSTLSLSTGDIPTFAGKELIGRGFTADVRHAAALDASGCVPVLKDGAYRALLVRGVAAM